MRNFFFIFLFLLACPLAHAQKDAWKTAEKYFNSFQYASAAKLYEQLYRADTSNRVVSDRLVVCYEKLNDPQKAEVILAAVCARPMVEPQYMKKYAMVLAENEKYDLSAEWYRKYTLQSQDKEVNKVLTAYSHFNDFYKDSIFYKIKKEKFNSDQSDFSPAYYKQGIVFCSARSSVKGNYLWDNSSFIDLYWYKDSTTAPEPMDNMVNSTYHEGPATFSSGFDTIFFTRNNYLNKRRSGSKNGVMKLKIFYATLVNGKWGRAQNFPLNNDEYSIGHPALSPDHTLYFVSEMPGGLGGTDIYYTKRVNGKWLPPVNLGEPVNTPGNEMFPFVDQQGNLYFASNAHVGLGGLDIFKSTLRDHKFGIPENMGYPVNSSKDDFGLIIAGNRGYFSSNRGNNLKDDNIYSFFINKFFTTSIQAVANDGSVLNDFSLRIINMADSTDKIESFSVQHSYDAKLNMESEYKIICGKEDYQTKEERLTQSTIHDLLLSRKPYTVVLPEAFTTVQVDLVNSEGKRLMGGSIWLVNSKTNEIKKYVLHSDATLPIELVRGINYELTGQQTGFKTKTQSISTSTLQAGPVVIELMSNEALFEKNEIGQIIDLDIKYDLGKATIRPDAAYQLDKLVEFLDKNPTVRVELGSHTDARGTEEDNLKLSQRRAESAVRYIVKKGIKSERLIPLGYGEDDLKVQNAVTEQEHQLNRRTTIKIVAI